MATVNNQARDFATPSAQGTDYRQQLPDEAHTLCTPSLDCHVTVMSTQTQQSQYDYGSFLLFMDPVNFFPFPNTILLGQDQA